MGVQLILIAFHNNTHFAKPYQLHSTPSAILSSQSTHQVLVDDGQFTVLLLKQVRLMVCHAEIMLILIHCVKTVICKLHCTQSFMLTMNPVHPLFLFSFCLSTCRLMIIWFHFMLSSCWTPVFMECLQGDELMKKLLKQSWVHSQHQSLELSSETLLVHDRRFHLAV